MSILKLIELKLELNLTQSSAIVSKYTDTRCSSLIAMISLLESESACMFKNNISFANLRSFNIAIASATYESGRPGKHLHEALVVSYHHNKTPIFHHLKDLKHQHSFYRNPQTGDAI